MNTGDIFRQIVNSAWVGTALAVIAVALLMLVSKGSTSKKTGYNKSSK